MSLNKGNIAPQFTLFDSQKNEVSLSDFQGRNVLLLFFPLAFTSVCTKELCTVRDDITNYSSLNTQVLAISVDSVFTLDKFKNEQNLPFPLLSDFNKSVSLSYGTLYEEFVLGMNGVSKRSAFVIDKSGVIQYAEVLESAGDVPNFGAIIETLNSI